jgi:hypothetical protein
MTMIEGGVIVGIDAHTDTHDAAVLDGRGRLLATRTFQANPAGYRSLLAWVEDFGGVAAVGVESTGSSPIANAPAPIPAAPAWPHSPAARQGNGQPPGWHHRGAAGSSTGSLGVAPEEDPDQRVPFAAPGLPQRLPQRGLLTSREPRRRHYSDIPVAVLQRVP